MRIVGWSVCFYLICGLFVHRTSHEGGGVGGGKATGEVYAIVEMVVECMVKIRHVEVDK